MPDLTPTHLSRPLWIAAVVVSVFSFNSTAWAQPMNDDCASSVMIADGSNNISNVGATFSGTESTCPTIAISQADPDTWYEYTASCTGSASAAVTNIAAADLIFAVYSDCTLANEITCEDAAPPAGQFSVMAGDTYTVRVFGWQGNTGQGILDIACFPTAMNDTCATAIPLADDAIPGMLATTGATNSGMDPTCAVFNSIDTWFEVTPSATGTLVVQFVPMSTSSDLSLFDSCMGSEIVCSSALFAALNTLTAPVTQGDAVRLRVATVGEDLGAYLVQTVPFPTNEDCATRSVIAAGTTPVSLFGATASGVISSCTSSTENDIWFGYTPTASGTLEIQAIGANQSFLDIATYTDCGLLAELSCEPTSGLASFPVTVGQEVVIRVFGDVGDGFVDIDLIENSFRRGDLDDSGSVELLDAILALRYLFVPPQADPPCLAAADFDGNGAVELVDVTSLLAFLFASGAAPVGPFPDCGSGDQFGVRCETDATLCP